MSDRPKSWPGPKAVAAARNRRLQNRKELLGCNGCGRAFVDRLVFDVEAQPHAPRGICSACQDDVSEP
jgi:hypothetical protein